MNTERYYFGKTILSMSKRSLDKVEQNENAIKAALKVFKSGEQTFASVSHNQVFFSERKERLVCAIDVSDAERYQLLTKVIANDGVTLYTSWSVLAGIEYFENLMNSHMKESKTREITFQHLNQWEARSYLELLSFHNWENFTWDKCIFSLHEQANYHQIEAICKTCVHQILKLPYSEKLYAWNMRHNIIEQRNMVVRLYLEIAKRGGDPYFPVGDEKFFTMFPDYCSECIPRNILVDWCVIRKVPYKFAEKYIKHCTNSGLHATVPISMVLECLCPESSKHGLLFTTHILKLSAIKYHNVYKNEIESGPGSTIANMLAGKDVQSCK